MKIEHLPLQAIRPYDFNVRTHKEEQVDRIVQSIKTMGWTNPIIIDEDGIILAGHGRYFAADKMGMAKVPCVRIEGKTEAEKRAYRIADNKLVEDSTWAFNNLELELGWLEDQGFELDWCGLGELKSLFPEPDLEVTQDETPAVPNEKTCYVKIGDIIGLGSHRLVCGDSTQEDPSDMIDMVITDPPYGVAYKGKTKDALEIQNDNLDEEGLSRLWREALDQIWPCLKEGGAIYAAVPAGPLRHVFVNQLLDLGALRQELVWVKDSMVLGRSDYHYKHEPILYGWKPGAAHYFTDDRTKTSVLVHDRPKSSQEHPTMKPLSLWAELIGNSSRRGEVVYDPFLGSGTTLIACEQLGRICHGVELDPKYCQVIIERYRKHCEKTGKPFECRINGEPLP